MVYITLHKYHIQLTNDSKSQHRPTLISLILSYYKRCHIELINEVNTLYIQP